MAHFFATGVGAPEGPVCLPDGSMYVTEMSAATLQVTRLFPDGGRKLIKRTGGRPNGLAVDGDGNLWIAEAGLHAVLCIDVEGRELLRIDHDGEQPFRLPNDLCFGKDGHLYLTDSGLAAEDFLDGQNFAENYRKLPWDGRVYEIDPVKGTVLRILDRGNPFHQRDRVRAGRCALRQRLFHRRGLSLRRLRGRETQSAKSSAMSCSPLKATTSVGQTGCAGATTAVSTARSTDSETLRF